ncbi:MULTISPECIES: TonB-dependent siderophore receptor [unclassified Bradyrhizobium]|uniref:TonB-dependent receptor n=1 Tax=unclassified Bradyrhizobium TaxID=2631580 RepID=UPI001FF4802D|nr:MULTISPECIES: TonB-dependent receptor [unclassified Bradyrhizobium]MCJ9703007.1 TonB-dependent receptor [Bradyrhizobium sp. SHOUNA76]MCJ9732357.1 TonB-dependent receptor [Bradyrhizobium sp. PRIMUS42]
MTRELSAKKIVRTLSLGAVSYLALSMESSGDFQHAFAQSNLPPVTVDAPKPRVRQPIQRSQSTRASRGQRSAATTAPRQAAPVPYVVPSTGTVGTVPPAYAGGQVASGGSLGLLGNRGVMNTPFNQTSYTAELIQNQQARTIRDVLANDPSVRVVQAAGGGADSLFIRGFYYDSGDYGLNGLYGIAPYYSSGANFVERVEVLKGPSALLNGMTTGGTGVASGGAVGGSINLITKHALDVDITRITGTYVSRSQFGANMDVSRRYGEHKEWGVRVNSTYSNGSTPWDRQTDEFGNVVVGLDYRGERARVAVDVGYQADNLTPPLRFFGIGPGLTSIPSPPKAGTNFQVPWAYYKPRDFFTTVRGEVDVTDWITAYAAFGYHDSKIDYTYPSPNILSAAGALAGRPGLGHETFETFAGEAGIRAEVDTGPVNHALNANYAINDRTYDQSVLSSAGLIAWNLYTPPTNVPQPNLNFPTLRLNTNVNIESVGVSDTMSMFDKRLQLTVGVRQQTAGSRVTNFIPTPANPSRPYQEASLWTPAYAVVFKPVENISLYANYIEGLQTPVVVTGQFQNAGAVFPPSKTTQAETGVKIDTGRLTTTLSLFEITQPSIITVPGLPLPTRQLNGKQRNRGVEINVFGEVTPDIRLLGGVALIDGVQEKTENGTNDGKNAIGVPAVTANIGAEWDTPFVQGLTFTGRVIYTASQYVNVTNTLTIPEWTRVDLGARYTFASPWNGKPIVVRAAVENVANKAYWASAYSGVITLAAPRTYLLSTTFNF